MIRSAATRLARPLAVASSSSATSSSSAPLLRRSIHIEKKMERLGIELPAAPLPKANYNIVCLPPGGETTTMYVSGHLPIKADGTLITGTLGPDRGGMTVEEGYDAARHCALNILATLKSQLGDLDRVEQVVKVRVFGIVNSHTSFHQQHLVMDGCSDLIMQVFDKPVGYHARSAIGTNTLPLNAPVEVEAIVTIRRE
ncbi:hypothetical protein ACHAXS_009955 [Conticribra weissflogii]